MTSSQQVYSECNQALDILSEVWESMLRVLGQVSSAASSSFTMEPDLEQLQKTRKEYEELLSQLKNKVAWLQEHRPSQTQRILEEEQVDPKLIEHQRELQQKSKVVTNQLKQILSQSYSLQFQIDLLLSSSHDQFIQ